MSEPRIGPAPGQPPAEGTARGAAAAPPRLPPGPPHGGDAAEFLGAVKTVPHAISYSGLIPPNLFILAALVGVLLAWRSRRSGLWLATAAVGALYLVSTPLAAYGLIRAIDGLAAEMPRVAVTAPPGAIIVLSADIVPGNVPGEPDRVGLVTLERLAGAARLQQHLGLPILVSGGRIENATDSLADAMSRSLVQDFHTTARWREDRSLNTFENAAFSAAILRRAGVPAAYVVTDPWQMARALWSFAAVGYPVVPVPSPGRPSLQLSPAILLPQVPSLLDSYYALHEMLGLAWYAVWYRHRS
jgi:uncharacterized SAM-binding protein YcdF (DUF218 family)